ncbi:hypothetical protein [uncultured Psychrosphaera sp.]|uniref:hypothetical protein n=2 Tax=Pseudomonadota TaxID=1224 RepID=UPI0030FC7DF1
MKIKLQVIILSLTSFLIGSCGETTTDSSTGLSGQSGSLASMTIANGDLHILNNGYVISFDLSGELVLSSKVTSDSHSWDAETIFNYNNEYLLVGTDNSVNIFSLNSESEELLPAEFVSSFQHLTARDPVIALEGIAYFTTRDGNESTHTNRDALGVLDISDITTPIEILVDNSLKEPYGLTLSNGSLFVCDKAAGLTKFSIEKDELGNVSALVYQQSYSIYPCNDVIANGDLLVLTDPKSINQVRVNGSELELVSKIELFY